MNLRWRLKEYWQKNRRQRWDICEESMVWHFVTKSTGLKFVKPGMSSHFSESRDPSCVSSAMYPECPRKEWRIKSFGLQSTLTGKWPRWRDYISNLAGSHLGVETAELSEIACCWAWGICLPKVNVVFKQLSTPARKFACLWKSLKKYQTYVAAWRWRHMKINGHR